MAEDQQAPPVEEQSTPVDQAGGEGSGVQAEGDTARDSTQPEVAVDEGEDLIGEDRYNELRGDPDKLRKELNRAATKKFQQLSSERKELEPFHQIVTGLKSDPRATVMAMAEELGIELAKPRSEAAAEKVTQTLSQAISERVLAGLGPEYEDLAQRLAPAIHDAVSMGVQTLSQPIRETQDKIIEESANREAAAAIAAFGAKHTDWKKFEPKMMELSKKLPPGEGITQVEYLENLYYLANRAASDGESLKRAAERVNRSTGSSDTRARTAPSTTVSETPSRNPTFAEAAAAAKAGKRYE